MNLRALHRTSAMVIATFALVHITNHLVSLAGISAHIVFMEVARRVYRQPVVELLLLSCVVFQVVSGLWFVVRGWVQRRGVIAWLQAISGTLLAGFLLIHVSAVMYGRYALTLDTNFYFAAAGFHVPPNQFFFGPYYFLAVLALFTHLGCAAYWLLQASPPKTRERALVCFMVVGAIISMLIVSSLAGKLQPVEVPALYKSTYSNQGS